MSKFGRTYKLEVQDNIGLFHVIEYPLTIEFYIKRDSLQTAKEATFRIYNLSKTTREAINKDYMDTALGKMVRLTAGYDDFQSVVFYGIIRSCLSYRDEGRTDYITEIHAYDTGFLMSNVISNISIQKSVSQSDVIKKLINDMVVNSSDGIFGQKLSIGTVSLGSMNAQYPDYSYVGPTWDRLCQETKNRCFIDNGSINILTDSDVLNGAIDTLDTTSGMLSPPKRYEKGFMLDILFEPRVKIGQSVKVMSSDSSLYNGKFKIVGLSHSGVISGSVNGKCKTTVMFIYPFSGMFNDLSLGYNL